MKAPQSGIDLKKKSSEQLEEEARNEVINQIMQQKDLNDDEKKLEVTKKLKELAVKQIKTK